MELDLPLRATKQLVAPKSRRPGMLSEEFGVNILALPPSGEPEEPRWA